MRSEDLSWDLKFAGASSLKRRQDSAAYRLNSMWYQTAGARALTCALLLAVLAFAVVAEWAPPQRVQSENRALPLNAPTAAQNLDRFNLEHRVTSGDTLSKISIRYYRLWSPEYDSLLRRANPDLPSDPRLLTTSIVVKVPLK